MQSLHFTAGTSLNGVIERDFTVGEVTGNSLVGRIRRRWRAPGSDGPRRPAQGSIGAPIGVPLKAVEPRITAAVFGLFWPDLAEVVSQITIPVAFDSSGTTPHRSPIPSRCSTSSPRRKDAARQRGTSIIRSCRGSRPTTRSGSSPGTSAGTAHHRPDMTGIGVRSARQAPRVPVPLDPCDMEHVHVDPGRAREPEDHRGYSP